MTPTTISKWWPLAVSVLAGTGIFITLAVIVDVAPSGSRLDGFLNSVMGLGVIATSAALRWRLLRPEK